MLKPYGYGYDPMFEESTETKCHQLPVVAGALLSLMALQHYAEHVSLHNQRKPNSHIKRAISWHWADSTVLRWAGTTCIAVQGRG